MKKKIERGFINGLIKGAIRDAVVKALQAKPVNVYFDVEKTLEHFYEINGQIYSESAAINKILSQYSWWKE